MTIRLVDGPSLNIVKVALDNVPAGVDAVEIMLGSPVPDLLYPGGGDWAAMVGAVVKYPCGSGEEPAQVTIIKEVQPLVAAPQEAWDFTGTLGDFKLPGTGGQQTFLVAPGDHVVAEAVKAIWFPSYDCDDGTAGVGPVVNFELTPGEHVTCTFLNELPQ